MGSSRRRLLILDPLKRGELDGFEGPPWAPPVDHLGLEQPVDGLREGVVIRVADAADEGLDAGLRQAFGVADREVLPGLKWSSQQLDGGRLRWRVGGVRIGPCGVS
jgi:hypothetical protein